MSSANAPGGMSRVSEPSALLLVPPSTAEISEEISDEEPQDTARTSIKKQTGNIRNIAGVYMCLVWGVNEASVGQGGRRHAQALTGRKVDISGFDSGLVTGPWQGIISQVTVLPARRKAYADSPTARKIGTMSQ